MNIEEACFDFDFLGMLPGKLICSRETMTIGGKYQRVARRCRKLPGYSK